MAKRVKQARLPRIGTLCRVSLGGGYVPGKVIDAYDSGIGHPTVIVLTDLSGGLGEPYWVERTVRLDRIVLEESA